ncbi:MAG: class I SAM-dependent methyltransferase [Thiotrichales bacterium]|nr:class I SAM-dependent methyltransferase [Thiotrichales bacterium]
MNPDLQTDFSPSINKAFAEQEGWSGSANVIKGFFARWVLKKMPFDKLEAGVLHISYAGINRHLKGKKTGCQADLQLLKPMRFLWLLSTQGELGFVTAYAEKVIETPSLYNLLLLGKQNETLLRQTLKPKNGFMRRLQKRHESRHNSVENSKRNIAAHYDLGNDFYRLWLDESMTYSSGLFSHAETDEKASLLKTQERKYQRLLDKLDSRPGEHILEIGCGWGGFAELAAKQQRNVTGITLSKAQHDYACERLANAGLSQQAMIRLIDYRHMQGQFNHIVSIEMFEAVGKEYWQAYFTQLNKLLKPGGRAALQIITIDEAYADSYQNSVDFIQAYIFPGGLLPSPTQIRTLAENHDLDLIDEFSFGQDYAKTLHQWLQNFESHHKKLLDMGYDESFQRIWRYYLDYCRVGFDTEQINVYQFVLEKPKKHSINSIQNLNQR